MTMDDKNKELLWTLRNFPGFDSVVIAGSDTRLIPSDYIDLTTSENLTNNVRKGIKIPDIFTIGTATEPTDREIQEKAAAELRKGGQLRVSNEEEATGLPYIQARRYISNVINEKLTRWGLEHDLKFRRIVLTQEEGQEMRVVGLSVYPLETSPNPVRCGACSSVLREVKDKEDTLRFCETGGCSRWHLIL